MLIHHLVSSIELKHYLPLFIYMTGVLIIGNILFHLTNLLKVPECLATPICGLAALIINFLLLKDFVF